MKEFAEIDALIDANLATPPTLPASCFVAPGAFVFGRVEMGERTSIWPGCSLRGDIQAIVIGEGTNIQDGSVVHVDDERPTIIGEYVTVGHRAIIHACTVGNECLIGMGAIVLDGAVIGERSIIGAGAVVTKNAIIPAGSMVLGCPAKIIRSLSEAEQLGLRAWAERYVQLSRKYLRIQRETDRL